MIGIVHDLTIHRAAILIAEAENVLERRSFYIWSRFVRAGEIVVRVRFGVIRCDLARST
jgi:hypothetical protein